MSKTSIRRSFIALAAVGLAVPAMADAGVDFPNFASTSGLNFVGNASANANGLRLTPSAASQRGAVWTTSRQSVAGGFTSTFTFRINKPEQLAADGFAFVIQNTAPTAIGADGGGLGYASNPVFNHQPGIANSLAVEFDTFNNVPGWADTTWAQHMSIQSRGTAENSPDAAFSLGNAQIPDITTGSLHTVSVTYLPGTMAIFLDGNLLSTSSVNLGNLLSLTDGSAYLGFTASTGGGLAASEHRIESWTLTSIPTPGAAALMALGGLVAVRRKRS